MDQETPFSIVIDNEQGVLESRLTSESLGEVPFAEADFIRAIIHDNKIDKASRKLVFPAPLMPTMIFICGSTSVI